METVKENLLSLANRKLPAWPSWLTVHAMHYINPGGRLAERMQTLLDVQSQQIQRGIRWEIMRKVFHATALGFFLLIIANALAAEPVITFKFVGVSSSSSIHFQDLIHDARAKVHSWWGPTYEQRISVETSPDRLLSMALIPAWRGERGYMSFGSKRVIEGQAAVIHEMIHVYAPNANRMLAEGLAVYGHEHLGGNAAYPTFGKDLHKAVAPFASKYLLLKLERTATPEALENITADGEAMSGSFVRFLIEKFGIGKFRALYDLTPLEKMQRNSGALERWQTIYGQPLDALADEWLVAIK